MWKVSNIDTKNITQLQLAYCERYWVLSHLTLTLRPVAEYIALSLLADDMIMLKVDQFQP